MAKRLHNICLRGPAGKGWTLPAAVLVTLFLMANPGALAEETLATVRGTVRAPTGVSISETTVVAKNSETEQRREVSSGAEGQFVIQQLPPGTYQVQASRAGFVSRMQKKVELRAGQVVQLAFLLEAVSGTQGREAQDDDDQNDQDDQNAGELETSSAAVSNWIDESQLVGLPLNGRSYSQLATLQAGVSDTSGASGARGVGGGGLTVAGGRSTSNTFLLDGTNIMNADNRVPRSAAGVQLGSDAVLQVQVFSSNYGAEYGRGSGGVMNSITRSGTPELHGTFFEFLRNSKLDAKNFFDPDGEPIPPFKRNQFGFMLTGPVWKDRTFFMASFEGLRDRLTETDTSFFPDELARNGIITDKNGAVLEEIEVNPSVIPYLALYPIPNAGSVGGGKGIHKAPRFLPTNEIFFTVRIDHKISDQDSLFGRYTFDDATSVTSGGPTFLFLRRNDSRQQYLTLVETHIVNPGLLNSFRFGFTRPLQRSDVLSLIDIPRELFFVPDAPEFGDIEVPGLSTFGNFQSGPQARDMKTLQFSDDVVAQKGSHALRFGFEVHRYNWDVFTSVRKGGNWSFNSLANFLQGGPQGTTLTVTLPGSDNRRFFRQTFLGFYAQDSYTITPNLQLSLGLRYEFTTLIRDKDGKGSFLPDPVRDLEVQIGPVLANNPSLNSFAPRLGLTWSPWSRGGTVLSAGFGVYYDQLIEYFVDRTKNSPPFFNMAVRTNFDSSSVFPDAVAAAAGIPVRAQILDYRNTDTPMVLRYNLELRQPLPGGWRLRASYVGARGNHLFRSYEFNLFPVPITRADGSLFFPDNCNDPLNRNPSALCRPNAGAVNPAFESILFFASDAQSFYNSLRLSGNRTFDRGFSLQASYTFSKSVDDASTHLFRTGQYGLNRTLDRGLSDFDIRHRLAINYFLAFPFGNGQRWGNAGPLSRVIGGWRLGGILRLRSGIPFSAAVSVRTPGFLFAANRPNLLPGASNNPTEGVSAGCGSVEAGQKLGGPDLYFDPCAFASPEAGTLGDLGRNTLISPQVFNMDISLQKDFLLDSKRRLQFRVDLFNLMNHPSFEGSTRGPAIVFSGSGDSPRRNSTAGKITGTVTTARQIQFALRLSF